MKSIGEKIYQLRKEKGLSQEDLAEKLNVARQTVSKWEVGSVSPNFRTLSALCKFFEVELNYFLDESEISKAQAEYSDNTVETSEAEKQAEIKEEIAPRAKHKILKIYITIFVSVVLIFGIIIGVSIGILYLKPYKGLTVITLNRFNYVLNYVGIVAACFAVVILITILILLIYYLKDRKK